MFPNNFKQRQNSDNINKDPKSSPSLELECMVHFIGCVDQFELPTDRALKVWPEQQGIVWGLEGFGQQSHGAHKANTLNHSMHGPVMVCLVHLGRKDDILFH